MQRRRRPQQLAKIRVVGVGSGGRTAVNGMLTSGVFGVDFITVDTDLTTQRESKAPLHIRIGKQATADHGTGGNAQVGREAALQSNEAIANALHGSDLVFIVAGLGGGTGSGAAPIVAQIARQQDALVIGIVTYPFPFEGDDRLNTAKQGVIWLRNWTDTLIVIPNERLFKLSGGSIGIHETYRLAHEIWRQSIQGISELVNNSGLINVDFADVRSIVAEGGGAIIATGRAKGKDRARQAAEQATHSELLGITIDGAHGILFNISGGADLSLLEVEQAAEIITRRAYRDANVIFGAAINQEMEDEICITVIATGFKFSDATSSSGIGLNRFVRPSTPSWQLEPASLHRIDRKIDL